MVGLVHAVADSLHEVGRDLARLEREDHVGGHGVVLELGVGNAVLDELFIEDCGLDADGKTVEVLDLRELAGVDGCEDRCAQDEKCKKNNGCFLHVHSSAHLKLMSISYSQPSGSFSSFFSETDVVGSSRSARKSLLSDSLGVKACSALNLT